MTCRSGCLTQDCGSYAACLKGMNLQIGDLTGQGDARTTDRRLAAYESARRQGVQPAGTQLRQVERAIRDADAG